MERNSIAKNSLFFALYRLLNVIYPLVTVSYVSKIIFASGVGKVASSQNIAQYFVFIAALGIPNYGVREIAKIRDNEKKVNSLFTELFSLNTLSTLVAVVLYYCLIMFAKRFEQERLLYVIAGIMVINNFFNVDWYYHGQEQFSYIMVRNFIVKIISLISIIAFVHVKEDYIIYSLIYVGGYTGNNIINFIHLKKYNVTFDFSSINIIRHLRPVMIMLCTTVAIELYTMVDTTMLSFIGNDDVVGYYSNAIKTVKVIISLVTSISAVLLPKLSYYYGLGQIEECEKTVNKITEVLLFMLIPCFIGVLMTAESIVPLFFGNDFLPAVLTMKILSFLIPVLGLSSLFGTQVLLTFNKEHQLLISTIVGAATNISLNYFLIPRMLNNGAALASVASEFVVTALTIYFSSRVLKIHISKKTTAKTVAASILMGVVVYFIGCRIDSYKLKIIIQISSGVIVFIASSFVLRNQIMHDLVKMIKNRK